MKTEVLRIRVHPKDLTKAEAVFARMGMTVREGVNMFFAQVALKKAIPFPVNAYESDDGYLPHIPNAVTLAAIEDDSGEVYENADAAMDALK